MNKGRHENYFPAFSLLKMKCEMRKINEYSRARNSIHGTESKFVTSIFVGQLDLACFVSVIWKNTRVVFTQYLLMSIDVK